MVLTFLRRSSRCPNGNVNYRSKISLDRTRERAITNVFRRFFRRSFRVSVDLTQLILTVFLSATSSMFCKTLRLCLACALAPLHYFTDCAKALQFIYRVAHFNCEIGIRKIKSLQSFSFSSDSCNYKALNISQTNQLDFSQFHGEQSASR